MITEHGMPIRKLNFNVNVRNMTLLAGVDLKGGTLGVGAPGKKKKNSSKNQAKKKKKLELTPRKKNKN
jgi:hypothetical protein